MASLEFIGRTGEKVYTRPGVPPRQPFVWKRALFVSVAMAFAATPLLAAADPATKLFEEGRRAERAGQMARAYLLYSQAAAIDPENQMYWLKSQAVRGRAALESPPQMRLAGAQPAATGAAPASSVFDSLTPKDRAAARSPQPPPELHGAPGQKDFDLRGDYKSLWEQVAHAFGLDLVFDGDYQPGQPIRFQLTGADYRAALHALEAATSSFVVPITSRVFLVAKDTEQKRRDVEPTVSVTVPVPQALAQQELIEIAQAVRQLFTLEHISWDTQKNMVVLRDRVSRVVPARQVFAELVHHRPQVDIEVDLLEVDRSYSLAYGVDLPTSFPLSYLGGFWKSPPSLSSIGNLAVFGGGQTLVGVAIANATLMANMSRAQARNLLRTEVRALDSLAATVHVGDQYPILTSGYFGPASFSNGQVYTPPPSFTFEDLGITVKVTPHIHGAEEVTLDLEAEFKVLSGQSLNGIPVISSRKLTSKVRLHEGEWGVVAGLLTSSEARTIHGIPILSDLPVLGRLIRNNTKDQSTTDVLLVIKPTLLNLPPDQYVTPTIWTGSETRPLTPL